MSIMVTRPASIQPIPVRRHPVVRPKPRPRPRPANPRSGWPAWTDGGRWELTDRPASEVDLRDFARPFVPSPESEALNVAFQVGYDHDALAVPPADLPARLTLGWWVSRNSGWLARDRDDSEIERAGARRRDPGSPITDADVYPAGCMS